MSKGSDCGANKELAAEGVPRPSIADNRVAEDPICRWRLYMAVVRLSIDPTATALVGAMADAAVEAGAEAVAEAPETGPDMSDTRLLWLHTWRRLYEWLVGGRGLGSRRRRALDAVLDGQCRAERENMRVAKERERLLNPRLPSIFHKCLVLYKNPNNLQFKSNKPNLIRSYNPGAVASDAIDASCRVAP